MSGDRYDDGFPPPALGRRLHVCRDEWHVHRARAVNAERHGRVSGEADYETRTASSRAGIMAEQHGTVPPTANLTKQDPDIELGWLPYVLPGASLRSPYVPLILGAAGPVTAQGRRLASNGGGGFPACAARSAVTDERDAATADEDIAG